MTGSKLSPAIHFGNTPSAGTMPTWGARTFPWPLSLEGVRIATPTFHDFKRFLLAPAESTWTRYRSRVAAPLRPAGSALTSRGQSSGRGAGVDLVLPLWHLEREDP
jgi:hypothetical protein